MSSEPSSSKAQPCSESKLILPAQLQPLSHGKEHSRLLCPSCKPWSRSSTKGLSLIHVSLLQAKVHALGLLITLNLRPQVSTTSGNVEVSYPLQSIPRAVCPLPGSPLFDVTPERARCSYSRVDIVDMKLIRHPPCPKQRWAAPRRGKRENPHLPMYVTIHPLRFYLSPRNRAKASDHAV